MDVLAEGGLIVVSFGRAIRGAELYNVLDMCVARNDDIPSGDLIIDASDIPTGAYRVVLGYRDGGTANRSVIVYR